MTGKTGQNHVDLELHSMSNDEYHFQPRRKLGEKFSKTYLTGRNKLQKFKEKFSC